jgi:hypothetical protein
MFGGLLLLLIRHALAEFGCLVQFRAHAGVTVKWVANIVTHRGCKLYGTSPNRASTTTAHMVSTRKAPRSLTAIDPPVPRAEQVPAAPRAWRRRARRLPAAGRSGRAAQSLPSAKEARHDQEPPQGDAASKPQTHNILDDDGCARRWVGECVLWAGGARAVGARTLLAVVVDDRRASVMVHFEDGACVP